MMNKLKQYLYLSCIFLLLPFTAQSAAPVIDESERFLVAEEQIAELDMPLAKTQADDLELSEDEALVVEEAEPVKTDQAVENEPAKLLEKIQSLQQEVQELRGQLEIQAHDLKLLQQQQLTFYKDLDARLHPNQTDFNKNANPSKTSSTLELNPSQSNAAAPIKPAELISVNARSNPADEQISYLATYDLIKNKRYDEALPALQTFVSQYPQGGYTANAQYWLGELYLLKNEHQKALEHFNRVLEQFPSSSKASASLLKSGYALAAAGQIKEAKIRLQQVIRNYPDTNTAQLASAKLSALDRE